MYYQEKWIQGKLMCRTTPKGEWREVSLETYRERMVAEKAEELLRAKVEETLEPFHDAIADITTDMYTKLGG